jgi:hypothetical protein
MSNIVGGKSKSKNPIITAVMFQDEAILSDPERADLNIRVSHGDTPLIKAVRWEYRKSIVTLLKNPNVDVFAINDDGWSAADFLIKSPNWSEANLIKSPNMFPYSWKFEIAKLLCERGVAGFYPDFSKLLEYLDAPKAKSI